MKSTRLFSFALPLLWVPGLLAQTKIGNAQEGQSIPVLVITGILLLGAIIASFMPSKRGHRD